MDATTNINECKAITTEFNDHATYKKKYDVIESIDEIESSIVASYTEPNNQNVQTGLFRQSRNAVRNSLHYMYNKYGSCFYIRIRDGSVQRFCYIWNDNFTNYLSKYLNIDPRHEKRYRNQDKSKWKINGAMIRVYEKKYVGYAMDFYYSETKYMIKKVCEAYAINDCDFIVFGKDTMAIKKDLTEPSEEVVGSTTFDMPANLKFQEYCPICSFNCNDRYADIALPTPDDIKRIFGLYVAPKCQNLYIEVPKIDWQNKKPIAVFRGTFTGMSARSNINPRLNGSLMSNRLKSTKPVILDIGLSGKGGYARGRKEINDKYIRFVDNNYWPYTLVDPLTHEQQSHYKYVVYMEGNAAAYRGAYLFSLGSVVLWVKPYKYHLWFENHLVDHENCIMIEHDLSNLVKKIKWLIANDKQAQQIAINGRKLYDTYLTKEPIIKYIADVLNTF